MKKIVICVSNTDEKLLSQIKLLKGSSLLESDAEIHFVSVFKEGTYIEGLVPHNFPSTEQYDEIKDTINKILKELANEVLGPAHKKVIQKCLFHNSPKIEIINYLKEVKADVVVCATRKNHGIEDLFLSSFTEHLCKFSPCDIYVIRSRS